MTLARDGWREMTLSTLTLGVISVVCAKVALTDSWLWLLVAVPGAGLWLFSIAFFRIPHRRVPDTPGVLVAPADGRITEISTLPSHDDIDGPALKISIFLSVFDVHINVAPCDGRVLRVDYKPGEFLDARHPECGIRNESNTLVIQPNGLCGPVIVRQIAGLIARRIVCRAAPGDQLHRGLQFGLIKFGSRTDLIVPVAAGLKPVVQIGQHVKGRTTILLTPNAPTVRPTATSVTQTSTETAAV